MEAIGLLFLVFWDIHPFEITQKAYLDFTDEVSWEEISTAQPTCFFKL
jgi:hypothetical protein